MANLTDKSLLEMAKQDPRSEAWFQLNQIYQPLIAGWIARVGVEESDVGDVAQEVMHTLAQSLAEFEHNGRVGAFRKWLKTITVNRCRRYWDQKNRELTTAEASNGDLPFHVLEELEDPNCEISRRWDEEHDKFVFDKMIDFVRNEFENRDFQIFYRNAVEAVPAKTVSDEFGVSVGNVYKIKFKILTRIKEVASGLIG